MNEIVEKYRFKYLKATNSLLLISIFMIVRTIFFLFNNESMLYLLEINRLLDHLGVVVSQSSKAIGIIIDLSMTIVVSLMIAYIWKEAQRGKIKIFIGFVIFYFLDMFLYFYSYDVVSFFIHFVFLAYMVFGLIFYKKMYVEYLVSKNKEKEE